MALTALRLVQSVENTLDLQEIQKILDKGEYWRMGDQVIIRVIPLGHGFLEVSGSSKNIARQRARDLLSMQQLANAS